MGRTLLPLAQALSLYGPEAQGSLGVCGDSEPQEQVQAGHGG